MSRFYIEGHEIDVEEPMFFIQKEELNETQDLINELLEMYK